MPRKFVYLRKDHLCQGVRAFFRENDFDFHVQDGAGTNWHDFTYEGLQVGDYFVTVSKYCCFYVRLIIMRVVGKTEGGKLKYREAYFGNVWSGCSCEPVLPPFTHEPPIDDSDHIVTAEEMDRDVK
jgi:hypothetical protein